MPEKQTLKPVIPMGDPSTPAVKRGILTGVNGLLEKILSVDKIRSIYNTLPTCDDPFQFLEVTLEKLKIEHTIDSRERDLIPSEGPVIVVSNHPFGAIDGLLLASVLSSVRRDIKILVNYFLENIHELRPLFFPVDPFHPCTSRVRNMASIKKALRWVNAGGMLVILPAGEVSHFSWKNRKIEDPVWNPMVSRIVGLTQAPVLPVFFSGRNSVMFQIAGLAHPRLRTAMLPRETLKKEGSEVGFKIGPLISYKKLSHLKDASHMTEYLRFRTYLLGMSTPRNRFLRFPNRSPKQKRKTLPIAPAVDPRILAREVHTLPQEQELLSNAKFSVYYVRTHQAPMILREIGRLREKTFRPLGEGTGNAVDLDRFDNIYVHLFVWSHLKEELVGAYRVGPTAEILPKHGKKGLYTQTLFKYRSRLLHKIGPALELGRTFVRSEYQRDYAPLMLLWKGIGQYIVRHPQYKTLFGAVSISSDYGHYSRQLMAAFLKVNNHAQDLSGMVKPRRPFRQSKAVTLIKEKRHLHQNDPDELSSWISGMEQDGKGVPILLKHYLKLGGKVLAFNLDPHFGNTLDGLIVVDLTRTDHKVLKRYMGTDGFEGFTAYHSGTAWASSWHTGKPVPVSANA